MDFRKNEHLVLSPSKGMSYKLWSLPVGTVARRKDLKVGGKEVNSFQILEHTPTAVYVESDWGYVFHLDSSLEADVI
jgi:hypothetical protein